MVPPELAFDRYLKEKHSRKEDKFKNIRGRVAVEDLAPNHVYRWLVNWMNHQLSDIGVTSTGGRELPPIHFDLVQVIGGATSAHVFEDDGLMYIVVTQPMVDEMLWLSQRLVENNRVFMSIQIAPAASLHEIAQFLLLMQFCLVTAHEYSHLVRGHWDDKQPLEIGESLSQAQELDADGYGIYHDLAYFLQGGGRVIAAQWLRISNDKALENSILDCFLLSMMLQFCARWAGRVRVEWQANAEHPPHLLRIEYSLLFVEMWCREVGKKSTAWMTDGTREQYFEAAASLFPPSAKGSWRPQISWLKGPHSEQFRSQIRRSLDRLRTGEG